MTITWRTPTTDANTTTGDPVVLNKPTGLANGDIMYACIATRDTNGVSTSTPVWSKPGAEWVEIYTSNGSTDSGHLAVFRKVVTDAVSEPASYSFDMTELNPNISGAILTSVGADTTTPEDGVTPLGNAGTSSTATFLGVTTNTDGSHLLAVLNYRRDVAITFNDSITELSENATSVGDIADECDLATGYLEVASAGATGDKTASSSESRSWRTVVLAIKPAGGGTTQVRTMQDLSGGFGPHKSQQLNGILQ